MEAAVSQLTPEQARETHHRNLVAILWLIRAEERVPAIAAALQEIERREQRFATIVKH